MNRIAVTELTFEAFAPFGEVGTPFAGVMGVCLVGVVAVRHHRERFGSDAGRAV
jgi:ureidoglycolate hydrolase